MKVLNTDTCKMALAAVCLIPAVASAADRNSDLSYTWAEFDYINLDIDDPNENRPFRGDFDNGGGYGLSGSLALGQRIFAFADYTETEADFNFRDNTRALIPGNTDILRLNVGLGFIMPMMTNADLVLSGGYSDIDFERFRLGATSSLALGDLDDDSSDGYMLDARLRAQLAPAIETSVGARYTDIGNLDGLSIVGNVMFELTPNWGLNLSVDAGEDLMTWGAGVRYSF